MSMENRVIAYTPIGKDGRLVLQVLDRTKIECLACRQVDEIFVELRKGVGALLIVEEALTAEFMKQITQFLKGQQTWSDLPILVLSKRGLESPGIRQMYQVLGNVTLLERPIHSVTLLTAVNAALRARKRQYEMREADRRKDEFLAMLAHELRNPLAPVSAASELLRIGNLDEERVKKTSEIISRQVRHMTGLIDDLLDVSRVSRGLVTLDQVVLDAKQILASAIEQVQPLITARQHRLTVHAAPESAFVKGDLKRLIQIVANLLNNAAKYTPEGGNIVLALEVSERNVHLSVTDNGIGMTSKVIDRVFEMFAQAERTPDRSQGGLGIGLALVKSLVELHGGEVRARSLGPGAGSTFSVQLPRIQTSVQSVARAVQNDASFVSERRRLLVVDDNVDATEMLGMCLEYAGYEIFIEHSAKAALDRVNTISPEICLLDIGLPDMDGIELARRLKVLPKTAKSMLIAITGYGQDLDRQKTLEAGFSHHFVKPVDMKRLLEVLAEPAAAKATPVMRARTAWR
jgi:signal transduction histidine kinase/CheY-like chemotaxis protein